MKATGRVPGQVGTAAHNDDSMFSSDCSSDGKLVTEITMQN